MFITLLSSSPRAGLYAAVVYLLWSAASVSPVDGNVTPFSILKAFMCASPESFSPLALFAMEISLAGRHGSIVISTGTRSREPAESQAKPFDDKDASAIVSCSCARGL